MELSKLQILVETQYPIFDQANPIIALFNPNRIQIDKAGAQLKDGSLDSANQPATLSIELFFDTSLPEARLSSFDLLQSELNTLDQSIIPNLPKLSTPTDVRDHTKKIYQLTENNSKLERPPLCQLMWGRNNILFEGFLKHLTKTFTRFLADGTPVRATLNCSFEEWQSAEIKQKKQNFIDDPIRTVRRGETLSSIAAEEYNDPSLWRVIATANKIDNPRQLKPGDRLTVPPLRPTSITQRRSKLQ